MRPWPAALNQLDPDVRELILARHFGGMSFKELARQWNIPLGTALARVHRGLKKVTTVNASRNGSGGPTMTNHKTNRQHDDIARTLSELNLSSDHARRMADDLARGDALLAHADDVTMPAGPERPHDCLGP